MLCFILLYCISSVSGVFESFIFYSKNELCHLFGVNTFDHKDDVRLELRTTELDYSLNRNRAVLINQLPVYGERKLLAHMTNPYYNSALFQDEAIPITVISTLNTARGIIIAKGLK